MGISPDLTDFPTFILLNASPLTSTGHHCLILYFFFALPQFLLLAISHWWRQLWMVGFTFTWETSKRNRTGQWDWTFHFLQYLVSMDGSSRYVLAILWGNIKKALMVKSAHSVLTMEFFCLDIAYLFREGQSYEFLETWSPLIAITSKSKVQMKNWKSLILSL